MSAKNNAAKKTPNTSSKPTLVRGSAKDETLFDITEIGRAKPKQEEDEDADVEEAPTSTKIKDRERTIQAVMSIAKRVRALKRLNANCPAILRELESADGALTLALGAAEELPADYRFGRPGQGITVGQSAQVKPTLIERYQDVLDMSEPLTVTRVINDKRVIVKGADGVQLVVPSSHLKFA